MNYNLPAPVNNFIKTIVYNGGIIENQCFSQYGGIKKYEVQIYYPNKGREFFIITDNGYVNDKRKISINNIGSMKQRNLEIIRLYNKEGMTQEFISKVFGLSQSMISRIVN